MFTDYLTYMTTSAIRTRGKPPKAATLRSAEMRLRGALRIGGFSTSVELATALVRRETWCSLLDRLYAQLAPVTVGGTVTALRGFGDYCVSAGLIPSHSVLKDDAPKGVAQKPITVYTSDEVAKLLLYAKASGNLRLWMLFATLAETGRRVGEMLGLRYEDMRLEESQPYFDLPETKTRQCYVPLTRLLREEVWTEENIAKLQSKSSLRYKRDAALYPFPWTYKNSYHHLLTLCESAEVPYHGWHVLRHTRATALITRGVPIAGVSSLLGHASVATTDKLYNHTNSLNFTRYID